MSPSIKEFYDVIYLTWPSVSNQLQNGWLIKNGGGGGKRVSATIRVNPNAKIEIAESLMESINQNKLFMIRKGDENLDYELHKLGYKLIDPSILLGSPIERLDKTFDGEFHVAPNEKMKALWINAGINEKRLNVMNRAKVLKSYVSIDNTAVAFVAIYSSIAMVHALEVAKVKQRQGFGKKIMQQIAGWAATNGANYLTVITVHNNLPAKSLYQHLRMTKLGNYHYRIKL